MIRFCWKRCATLGRELAVLLAVGLLISACNRSGESTPTPLPTTALASPTESATAPTPETAETAPPATVTSSGEPSSDEATGELSNDVARQGSIFTSPRYSYTVALPCCWLALPTPGTALESALAELQEEGDGAAWGDLSERVRERASGAMLELIALLPAEENAAVPVAQMTISVLPANGMTLEQYLAATQAELDNIANTTVLAAAIEPALGVGALPASVIEYTAAPTPANANSEQTIAGYQVAFLGTDADSFIVMTFTTTTERFAELQPEFQHIVRTVTLGDPTAYSLEESL